MERGLISFVKRENLDLLPHPSKLIKVFLVPRYIHAQQYLSHKMRKYTFVHVRSTKTDQPAYPRSQIKGVRYAHEENWRPWLSENVPRDDSVQIVKMCRLI